MAKTRLAVFVSGGGTNLQSIIDSISSGYLSEAEIAVVVSSRKKAYALKRAAKAGIPSVVCSRKDCPDIDEYGNLLLKVMDEYSVDLVVLAGFMSILSTKFIERYSNRIMNTHPALIPSFCGKGFYGDRVHRAVLEYGVKVSGATIMFVNEEVDAGPIILQKVVPVSHDDTIETLKAKVMPLEHQLYPQAIKLFAQGRLRIEGRRVAILPEQDC